MRTLSSIFLFYSIVTLPVLAESEVKRERNTKIGEHRSKIIKFQGFTLDVVHKRIEIEGHICLRKGVIEYLACVQGGKEHESLIRLGMDPLALFSAVQNLGLNPGQGVEFQGQNKTPSGESVYLYVEWEQEGRIVRHRAEDLIWNVQDKRPMQRTNWIFVGSRFEKDYDSGKPVFMASLEGNIVSTFHDPYVIFDHPLKTGADDTVYEAHTSRLPSPKTPIKLIVLTEELSAHP